MPIMRFDHLTILTRNIEASWEFYHQLPNSEVKPLSAGEGYFEVSFDDSVIGVFDSAGFASATNTSPATPGGAVIQFSVEDVDEYWSQLPDSYREASASPKKMPWGSYSAYISDPDGNILEFYTW